MLVIYATIVLETNIVSNMFILMRLISLKIVFHCYLRVIMFCQNVVDAEFNESSVLTRSHQALNTQSSTQAPNQTSSTQALTVPEDLSAQAPNTNSEGKKVKSKSDGKSQLRK